MTSRPEVTGTVLVKFKLTDAYLEMFKKMATQKVWDFNLEELDKPNEPDS